MPSVVFKKVTIENFLSIGESVQFDLENQGLVLITGNNLDSSVASSNGSGKSSLLEGLVWSLWGRTVRGYTSDEVVNRKEGRNCRVALELEHDGSTYLVTRYRKHSSKKNSLEFYRISGSQAEDLTQQTTADTQVKVDELLGLDYDTFIRGPMLPQGSFKRFSQMADAEMKRILERALEVDVLAEAHEWVRNSQNELATQQSVIRTELQSCGLQKASLNQLLVDYRHNESVFQIEQNNKIMELQNELQELIEKRARLESEFNEVELRQSLQQAELAKLGVASIFREVVDRWEAELEKISDQIHDATTEVGRCDGVLGQLKKRRAKILALKGDCPTCEQPITQRHQQHALSAIDSEIATASEELIRCNQGVSDLSDTERATKLARDNEIAVSRSFVDEASTKLEEIKSRWSAFTQAVGAINWIDQALERRTQQIESARNEQSSWDRMILATEQKLAELAKVESVLKVKDRRCVFELDHLQFWREGFSNQGLKSFILNAVTPYMNQRASHYSQLLTGGEIDIKFNTQSTLKTGKVREQFAVEVVNRNGANTYAGNSGGERARTDLAINFVLSDLVAQRSHRSYPQRFFDEPFEGLDEAGVEAVMDLLADMVQEAGSVFVITHQPGMQSLFNRSIEVVKQNGRTTIKQ